MAPVPTGSSAYVPAAQARAGTAGTMCRVARYAVAPASGTEPSSSTDTATQVLPSASVDRAASTATYGGAQAVEPNPTSW